MDDSIEVQHKDDVVVRFAGDSGDGMQLVGTIFSTVSAEQGNAISTFPDFPADVRAPQGSLTGVSGFQVHIAADDVYTPGDECDVLVAMNAAALKTQYKHAKRDALIIVDSDAFGERALRKAEYADDDYLGELGIARDRVLLCPMTTLVKSALADSGMDNKAIVKCRNMFALGLVSYLFDRDIHLIYDYLAEKFATKPAVAAANRTVVEAGYTYGHNTRATTHNVYRIESRHAKRGRYMDITGNKATAYGLLAAAERASLRLFLASYPITPASDILHELAKHKALGVITMQCEDEIAACASAIGASFAGAIGVTSTSGPGLSLKSEAINLAVMSELPLVVVDVQRGGPSTGLPTKSEQTDLLQALVGRNGESPLPVLAAASPTDAFDMAYAAVQIAVEYMTPVILLSDAFIANGSAAFRLPHLDEYPAITPPTVPPALGDTWTPYLRRDNGARYWARPGEQGREHVVSGLEHNGATSAISIDPDNHNAMVQLRAAKIKNIAVPDITVLGDDDDAAALLIVGWGGTYGHLHAAMDTLRQQGHKIALAAMRYINPLPANTAEVMHKYNKVMVVEENSGQLAAWLRMNIDNFVPYQHNAVTGQPFTVNEIVAACSSLLTSSEQ